MRQEERAGRRLSAEQREEILRVTEAQCAATLDPRYAAARLWLDSILAPPDTRAALITALDVAAHNPEVEPFRTGVLQV